MRRALFSTLVAVLFTPVFLFGQQVPGTGGSTSTTASAANSPAAAGGGPNLAIESQAIAYEAINRIARHIGLAIRSKSAGLPVLLGSQTNLANVASYFTLAASAQQIIAAYDQIEPVAPGQQTKPGPFHAMSLGTILEGAGFGPSLSGVATLLGAMKAQTTMANGTFSAVDQALYSDIEAQLGTSMRFVVTPYPKDLSDGNTAITLVVNNIYKARQGAADRLIKAHESDKPPYDPTNDLKGVDAELAAFQASLTNPANASISGAVLGAGVLCALKALDECPSDTSGSVPLNSNKQQNSSPKQPASIKYTVLILSDDVAGGGSRANQYFFISLFFPSLHPSFNGGAVVSYTLRDQNGGYLCAETLRYVFGYSKWHDPPLRGKASEGYKKGDYSNFDWP